MTDRFSLQFGGTLAILLAAVALCSLPPTFAEEYKPVAQNPSGLLQPGIRNLSKSPPRNDDQSGVAQHQQPDEKGQQKSPDKPVDKPASSSSNGIPSVTTQEAPAHLPSGEYSRAAASGPVSPPDSSDSSADHSADPAADPALRQPPSERKTLLHQLFPGLHLGARWRQKLDVAELDNIPDSELKERPLLYWRKWANKPLPVVPASIFLWFITLGASLLMPVRLSAARDACQETFWRSLAFGLLTTFIGLALARLLFISEIGVPLAVLILGCVELLFLLGFVIVATLIGERIARRFGWLRAARPRVTSIIVCTIGVVILGCILAIPGVGRLPPLGVRLVTLLCALGIGAFVKVTFTRRSS